MSMLIFIRANNNASNTYTHVKNERQIKNDTLATL